MQLALGEACGYTNVPMSEWDSQQNISKSSYLVIQGEKIVLQSSRQKDKDHHMQ